MIKMANNKSTTSLPDISHAPVAHSPNNGGTKSFDMQNREVDAAKSRTPSGQATAPYNSFSKLAPGSQDNANGPQAPIHTKGSSLGDGGMYKGKKKGSKAKNSKFNGENTHQPDKLIEQRQLVKNNNSTGRKNKGNSYFDGGKPFNQHHDDRGNFNKSGGFVRSNRANTVYENHMPRPRPQVNDNPGHHSLRSGHYAKITPVNRKVPPNADHGPPSHLTHRHHLPLVDPMGFRSPSGSWYPHENPQMMIAQHFQHGPPPPFLSSMPQSPLRIPVFMPPQQQHGPPLSPTREHVLPPPSMGVIGPQPTFTSLAHTTAQNTPSTGSTATVVSASAAATNQNSSASAIQTPRQAHIPSDPRPTAIRIDSLVTTIIGQLEGLKTRIIPGAKNEIAPTEMARYLDTAICMCKDVQIVSLELAEDNKMMLNQIVAICGNGNNSQERNGAKIGGVGHCSHSASPRGQSVNGSNNDNVSAPLSNSDIITDFVLPVPEYAGFIIDRNRTEQSIKDKNLISANLPWWLKKERWQRINFATGEEAGVMDG
jgi:hypothetical protein